MTSERLAIAQVDSVLSADGRRPARPPSSYDLAASRQANRPSSGISERRMDSGCGLAIRRQEPPPPAISFYGLVRHGHSRLQMHSGEAQRSVPDSRCAAQPWAQLRPTRLVRVRLYRAGRDRRV